jgi:hypothetical protein
MLLEPCKSVPKKYWKYALKFPDYQLYKIKKERFGAIVQCYECKKEIPSLERFILLLFREPTTQWKRRSSIALCNQCVEQL